MKKLFLMLVLTAFSLISLTSCEQDSVSVQDESANEMVLKSDPEPDVTFYLFFTTWDGRWGREIHDCDRGWGFCEAESCFFCCVNGNEEIVDCDTGEVIADEYIPVIINPITSNGYLDIKLDPSNPKEADAINNKSIFHIDENINASNLLTLHKGQYQFDSSIGSNGGYRVLASKI